jgi:hypothetical protein
MKNFIDVSMSTFKSISRYMSLLGGTLIVATSAFIAGCGDSHRSLRSCNVDSVPDTATVYITHEDFNPIVNVYIENSGSMDGYVNGQTEFEDIVYNYLVDIKLAKITDSLNLFYINSDILPQQNDVQDFIKKLEPSSFKAKGGKRGSSDIAQMIDMIMQEMNDSTVSIFISDCIFSPGKGKNASSYLTNQQIGVKNSIGSYFNNHPTFSVLGYRCVSTFDGKYFDKEDVPTYYKGNRPFYVWLFGTHGALKRIQIEMAKNNFALAGVENEFSAMITGRDLPDSVYAVKHQSGNFSLNKRDVKHSIQNLKKGPNGKASFAIEANLASVLLNEYNLCDTACYRLSDSHYTLVSAESIKEYKKYSHLLKFEADKPFPSRLEISLLSGVPRWVEFYNDETGEALTDATSEQTYGIKYLVNGIAEAIIRKPYYTRMTININK